MKPWDPTGWRGQRAAVIAHVSHGAKETPHGWLVEGDRSLVRLPPGCTRDRAPTTPYRPDGGRAHVLFDGRGDIFDPRNLTWDASFRWPDGRLWAVYERTTLHAHDELPDAVPIPPRALPSPPVVRLYIADTFFQGSPRATPTRTITTVVYMPEWVVAVWSALTRWGGEVPGEEELLAAVAAMPDETIATLLATLDVDPRGQALFQAIWAATATP